jgi:NAD(P)-dependent dehydrogenase (short-subunit alcohol dehydrogenase family)
MYESLTNQRAVITGITGGIAHATAELLLSLGAEVIVTARSKEKLDQALSTLSGNVSGVQMDLKDEQSVKSAFEQIGAFDHLVTPAASSMFSPIADMDFSAAREMLETKQWGQLLCVNYALPNLNKKSGSVTLFSGTVTQKPLAGATMFAAVGAATEASARIWAFESGPIRFNTIVPGIIETPVWGNLMGAEAAGDALGQFSETLPVQRTGTPEDVAKAVLFLIDNGFVNGISLVVDGGHRLV